MNVVKKMLPLKPVIVEKVWGGERLAQMKGLDKSSINEPIGETWEISALEEGSSTYSGQKLSRLGFNERLTYVVKFIDTSDFLSVQVHPDDNYAAKVEGGKGKTECWLILNAEEGAGLYLGFKEGVDRESFEKDIKEGKDISSYLKFHSVSPGDFFYVPSGTIHTLGPGITLAEIQQACGKTYRVWDWNRVSRDGKSRELHLDKALDVLKFSPEDNRNETFKMKHDLFELKGIQNVVEHPDFKVSLINASANEVNFKPTRNRPLGVISIGGTWDCELQGGGHHTVSPFEAFLIPEAKMQKLTVRGEDRNGGLLLIE